MPVPVMDATTEKLLTEILVQLNQLNSTTAQILAVEQKILAAISDPATGIVVEPGQPTTH